MSARRPRGSRPAGAHRAAGTERSATNPQSGLKGSAFGEFLPRACPDCGVLPERNCYVHAATCPLSLAVDAALDDDARWFREHPGESERRRPVMWGEAAEHELMLGWRPSGTVIVIELAPGVRSRYLSERGAP